jgi:hypothetical protein
MSLAHYVFHAIPHLAHSPLVHKNPGGAMLGTIAGGAAAVALAATPLGWGIAIVAGMGGGAVIEDGLKKLGGK